MQMYAMSDKRLKKNIRRIGETEGGSNLYEWDWKDGGNSYLTAGQPTRGVIAQEHPEATKKTKSGYLAVDYSRIQ